MNPQQPVEVQVPIFPIPVRSNESFMMYALCLHAIETGVYDEMPLILPHLKAMKDGLEMSYQKLKIPMFEYRKFVIIRRVEPVETSDQNGGKLLEEGEEQNGTEGRLGTEEEKE